MRSRIWNVLASKRRVFVSLGIILVLGAIAFSSLSQGVASATPEQQLTAIPVTLVPVTIGPITAIPITPVPVTYTSYSVKFVCGDQTNFDPEYAVTRPASYATDINIHNYHPNQTVSIRKHILPLVQDGRPHGREPGYMPIRASDAITLPPSTSTFDDCQRIWRLLGAAPGSYYVGFFEIVSTVDLSIDAVYTASTREGSITIESRFVRFSRLSRSRRSYSFARRHLSSGSVPVARSIAACCCIR